MTKVALVVDDSSVARHVLRKVLSEHGVAAVPAASAEEALDYLKHHRPNVVFMDHLMPGMDGFEALEAIKANPATATIPVMMYTSQDGELYVGQARALGAFGVLPKDLKPTEVTHVLRALRLIPDERSEETGSQSPKSDAASVIENQRVRALLQELFYQQHAALRDEIREGYERVAANTAQQPVLQQAGRSGRATRFVLAGLVAIFFVSTVVLWSLLSSADRSLAEERLRSVQLGERIVELEARTAAAGPTQDASDRDRAISNAWEQAIAFSGQYAFGTIALDDIRAEQLIRLVDYLNDGELSGTVEIDVHVGQFCMNRDAEGQWVLAPSAALALECERQGWDIVEAEALGARRSIQFANVESTIERAGNIGLEIRSAGAVQPAVPYPVLTEALTAGEWNEIARLNHYVALRLLL